MQRPADAEFKSWFEAGLLIRGRVVNELKSAAWKHGLEFEHERAGRMVRFRAWGRPEAVSAFRQAYGAWARRLVQDGAEVGA